MPRLSISEQALRLATSFQSTQHVCRSCRAQATRHFSVSSTTPAQLPFFKRLQNSVFGTPESREANKKRDELNKKRVEKSAKQGKTEKAHRDSKGRVWKKASIVDPSRTEGYVPATDWTNLEKVGGAEWVRARRDEGEVYIGCVSWDGLVGLNAILIFDTQIQPKTEVGVEGPGMAGSAASCGSRGHCAVPGWPGPERRYQQHGC